MSLPVYRRISDDLRLQIVAGDYEPGAQLPPETSLAAQYGVSRMTVRQALDQLESERLVARRRGAGTFVAASPTGTRRLNRLADFEQELGLTPGLVTTAVLDLDVVEPDPDVVTRLDLKSGQKVTRVERIRSISGSPVALQRSWVTYTVAPTLSRLPLVAGSLYRTLRDRYGISIIWAEQEISAQVATAELASALSVRVGAPLLAIARVAFTDRQQPVEFALSWTVASLPLSMRLDA